VNRGCVPVEAAIPSPVVDAFSQRRKRRLRADIAVCAGAILDIERLADIVLHLGRDDAREAVGNAGCGGRHQNSNLAVREIAGLGRRAAIERDRGDDDCGRE
jgi:hypothetical protein